ncbi:MAG: hypothetical protein WBA68_12625 [Alteraurantiacibacter sp.]
MREALDQMLFVYAAYGVGVGATLVLVAQSWLAMRRAEARRDRARQVAREG